MKEDRQDLELIEAIRKRPAMYIGSTGVRGFTYLLRGLIRFIFNSLQADAFSLELSGPKSGQITFENVNQLLDDRIFSSSKESGGRMFGYEFAVLNALSSKFVATLLDDRKETITEIKFARGFRVSDSQERSVQTPSMVKIGFDLDGSVLSKIEALNPNYFIEELRTFAYLYKGKSLALEYYLTDTKSSVLFRFDRGLSELVDLEQLNGHSEPLFATHVEHDFDEFSIDVAFFFRGASVDSPQMISFVNEERTMEHGVHVSGLINGLFAALVNFQNESGLKVESELSKKGVADMLVAAIHLKMGQPHFEGATRRKLISRNVAGPMANYLGEVFLTKLNESPSDASNLVRMVSRRSGH